MLHDPPKASATDHTTTRDESQKKRNSSNRTPELVSGYSHPVGIGGGVRLGGMKGAGFAGDVTLGGGEDVEEEE